MNIKIIPLIIIMILGLSLFAPVQAISPVFAGSTGFDRTFQTHGWYSAGRWWVLFGDGTNIVYQSSTDGITWSAKTIFLGTSGDSKSCDAVLAPDGTTIHIIAQRWLGGANPTIFYRMGTCNANGSITWAADYGQINDTNPANEVTINLDFNGYPWYVVSYNSDRALASKRSTTKNGIFTHPPEGLRGIWGSDSFDYDVEGKLYRLPAGGMYVIYSKKGTNTEHLYGKNWNTVTLNWGAEELINPANHLAASHPFSAISDGTLIYLTYKEAVTGRGYLMVRNALGVWEDLGDVTGEAVLGSSEVIVDRSFCGIWLIWANAAGQVKTLYYTYGVAPTNERVIATETGVIAFQGIVNTLTGGKVGILFYKVAGLYFDTVPLYSSFRITNMEGSDINGVGLHLLVVEQRFYDFDFNATGIGISDVNYLSVRFTDGLHPIQIDFNVTTGLSSVVLGADYIIIQDATHTHYGDIINVHWNVWLKATCIDREFMDIETYYTLENGMASNWDLYDDYASLYNLGFWTTNTASGYATSTTATTSRKTTTLTTSTVVLDKTTTTTSVSTTISCVTSTSIVATSCSSTTYLTTNISTKTTYVATSCVTTTSGTSTQVQNWTTTCQTATIVSSTRIDRYMGLTSIIMGSTTISIKLSSTFFTTSTTSYGTTTLVTVTTSTMHITTSTVSLSLVTTTTQFNTIIQSLPAGKSSGGDVFDLFVYPNSEAAGYVKVRNLQNVHALVNVRVNEQGGWDDHEADEVPIEFGINYWTGTEYVTGWSVKIELVDGWIDANTQRLTWNIGWYYNGALQMSSIYINSFPYANDIADDQPTTTTFIVDLWYNKMNSSSVIGGRVTAYNYAVSNTANIWLRWMSGGVWGAVVENATQVMFFHDLENGAGGIISARQIEMSYVWAKISQEANANGLIYSLQDWDVLDFATLEPNDSMDGINTPSFVQTRMPEIASSGFLNSLWASLQQTFQSIAGLFSGTLGFLGDAAFNFVDSILAYFGLSGSFRDFTAFIIDAWTALFTQLDAAVTMIISTVTIVASIFGYISYYVVTLTGQLLFIITTVVSILTGVSSLSTGLGDIWATLNIGMAFPLISIIVLVQWWESIDNRSHGSFGAWIKIFIEESQIFLGVTLGIARFLIDTLYLLVINIISFIRALMPIV
jgi:hypothetical protein